MERGKYPRQPPHNHRYSTSHCEISSEWRWSSAVLDSLVFFIFLVYHFRWLLIHVPFTNFMRSIFDVVNTGPVPPAILRLSDGGHIENLALLPLLKRRLQRIVVVNGGYTYPDSRYGDSLVQALKLARDKLHCSFIGLDGRDVLEDIQYRFVAKTDQSQPRSYRFKVEYYDKTKAKKKGEGEVLLIAPRRPQDSTLAARRWSEVSRDPSLLEGGLWGSGPDLTEAEVSGLTGCCCECCHGSRLWKSCSFGGDFPQHTTANQFFTPTMFAAYHREGYCACLEAEADVFLGGGGGSPSRHVTRKTDHLTVVWWRTPERWPVLLDLRMCNERMSKYARKDM